MAYEPKTNECNHCGSTEGLSEFCGMTTCTVCVVTMLSESDKEGR